MHYLSKGFDLLTYWKSISLGLAGLFGSIGLLTDVRDKHTKRITRWGWVSLIGIFITTVGGIAAEIFDQTNDARTAADNSTRALSILQNTSNTLGIITSMNAPTVTITFPVTCVQQRNSERSVQHHREVTQFANDGFDFYFFQNREAAKEFSSGDLNKITEAELSWFDVKRPESKFPRTFPESGDTDDRCDVTIPGYHAKQTEARPGSSRTVGIYDLPGMTLLVYSPDDQMAAISNIYIYVAGGAVAHTGQLERLPKSPASRGSFYIYSFPEPSGSKDAPR
jgi:hypothetical protein